MKTEESVSEVDRERLLQLSKPDAADLRRRREEMESPVRFVVMSEITRRFRFYFDATEDMWVTEFGRATFFKQAAYAKAILKVLAAHRRRDRTLKILKITTCGKKPKVVRYLEASDVPDHLASYKV